MKKTLALFALLFTVAAHSQILYKAKLTMANGDIKEGYANIPSNSMLSGAITFKPEKKGKGSKIKNDDVKQAVFYSDNGNEYHFEHSNARNFLGKNELMQIKNGWFLVTYGNPHITVYNYGASYYIDKEGSIVTKSFADGSWSEIFVGLKRDGEEVPTFITSLTYGAMVGGQESRFRKAAKQYFTGEDKFIERIENKEWEHEQVKEMAEAYSAYMAGK